MSIINQLPQKIDSNVTIYPPEEVEIRHAANLGWYIKLDGVTVTHNVKYGRISVPETIYWEDASGPMDYLIEKHLVVTKAYKELDKACKKVAKSNSKSTTE